jgi:hypothetical protein
MCDHHNACNALLLRGLRRAVDQLTNSCAVCARCMHTHATPARKFKPRTCSPSLSMQLCAVHARLPHHSFSVETQPRILQARWRACVAYKGWRTASSSSARACMHCVCSMLPPSALTQPPCPPPSSFPAPPQLVAFGEAMIRFAPAPKPAGGGDEYVRNVWQHLHLQDQRKFVSLLCMGSACTAPESLHGISIANETKTCCQQRQCARIVVCVCVCVCVALFTPPLSLRIFTRFSTSPLRCINAHNDTRLSSCNASLCNACNTVFETHSPSRWQTHAHDIQVRPCSRRGRAFHANCRRRRA